jgi:DNA-binding HxlR family transcriptional regulator
VACALDVFGDRWTLIIVRDLVLGRTRFKEFVASPEGIPTNILSERLSRLLSHGIVTQVSAGEGSGHLAYRLTDKGRRVRQMLHELFARHAETLEKRGTMGLDSLGGFNRQLRQMERFWADQIRYIY